MLTLLILTTLSAPTIERTTTHDLTTESRAAYAAWVNTVWPPPGDETPHADRWAAVVLANVEVLTVCRGRIATVRWRTNLTAAQHEAAHSARAIYRRDYGTVVPDNSGVIGTLLQIRSEIDAEQQAAIVQIIEQHHGVPRADARCVRIVATLNETGAVASRHVEIQQQLEVAYSVFLNDCVRLQLCREVRGGGVY